MAGPEDLTSKSCTGLFGPCLKPVTHCLEDPEGKGEPVHLCDEHWEVSELLRAKLAADPEFSRQFEQAIREKTIPTRFQRKPVI